MVGITVPIKIDLPENWVDLIIERIKQDDDWAVVVRCKDCVHRIRNEHWNGSPHDIKAWCALDNGDLMARNADDDDWFCADGKRRDYGEM